MIIKLSKAILIKDKETDEINLDLESMNGQHLIDATTEARVLGDKTPVPEFSKTYQAVIAAKAAGLPVDTIIGLPAKDFSLITRQVVDFLFE